MAAILPPPCLPYMRAMFDRAEPSTKPISAAFAAESPRVTPRPASAASLSIYVAVAAIWVALFICGFILKGPFAWASGMAYVTYDTVLLLIVAANTTWMVRKATLAPELAETPGVRQSLGIIIAAKNEAAGLPATIHALLNQDDAPDEILIADDGSNDATPAALLKHFGLSPAPLGEVAYSEKYPSVRWLRLPHGGKARALNAAIEILQTDIVLTVDADTLLDRDAIGAMRKAFANEPNLVAATGVLTPVCANTASGRFFQLFQSYEYVRNFISRAAWMKFDALLLISGAFAGFRRESLRAVGGFDPDCLVEDYELIHRLHRHSSDHGLNWRVRVIGAAHATTDAPSEIMPFLRQRRRWFGGFLQTQYWNKDMTANAKYGRLGTVMLPIKAVDTMQPLFGLTAFFFLLYFLALGQLHIAATVFAIMLSKIAFDLAFHLWSVHLYQRWMGDKARINPWHAVLTTALEPFSFQLLRHFGAAWGWIAFLRNENTWSSGTLRTNGSASTTVHLSGQVINCAAE